MRNKLWFMRTILQLKNLTLCLFAFFCLAGQQARGSHSMGADLTYTCLGGNTYQVTITFYRDCIGIAAPPLHVVTEDEQAGVTSCPVPGRG